MFERRASVQFSVLDVLQLILDFFSNNSGAIIVGIVSSIIVILLQTSVRTSSILLATWLGKGSTLAPIWGFYDAPRIYVVSGSIIGMSSARQAVLMGPDADAANESISTLRFLRPNTELIREYSPGHPEEQLRENAVSIGGPTNNIVTRRLMKTVWDRISFQDDEGSSRLVEKFSAATVAYEASYDDNDAIQTDYGLILKIPNPFDNSAEVLILAGCDTPGVLAAARSISLHPDGRRMTKTIRKRLGRFAYFRKNYFVAIVRCDVIGNEVGKLDLVKFHLLDQQGRRKKNP